MRKLHKLYAHLFGYFWHLCPVCGKYFGGHELTRKESIIVLYSKKGRGKLVCPDPHCAYEAGVLNTLQGHQSYIRATTKNYLQYKEIKTQKVEQALQTRKKSNDSFEEEKLQYAEDSKTHEKPWELWQWAPIDNNPDCEDWKQLNHAPSWWYKSKYRRKPMLKELDVWGEEE